MIGGLPTRVVPPVHSPLDLAAIIAGLRAVLHGGDGPSAEARGELTARLGPRELLLTGSGTTALTLALRAAARSGAVPIALPAFCCYDVATAADGADVPVLLYDVDPATLSPDLHSLERVLTAGARTVVMAHFYGLPVDAGPVLAAAARHDAVVIDDAAQSAGATWRSRPLGTLGALGVLSFGRGKGITAGRGGALLANDANGATALETIRSELQPARTALDEPITAIAQWLLARPALYALPASLPFVGLGETVYHPAVTTRAMSPFAAAMLRRTLTLADAETEHRRATAQRWVSVLARQPKDRILTPPAPPEGTSSALRQPVVVLDASLRAWFASPAARGLGIVPSYPKSLADLDGFRGRVRNAADDFPGARLLAAALFTLPTHSQLHRHDLQRIEGWLSQL